MMVLRIDKVSIGKKILLPLSLTCLSFSAICLFLSSKSILLLFFIKKKEIQLLRRYRRDDMIISK
jgi:hypothetical protein